MLSLTATVKAIFLKLHAKPMPKLSANMSPTGLVLRADVAQNPDLPRDPTTSRARPRVERNLT